MASRIAILVEAWQIKNHVDVPGARVDVDNYDQFLRSEIGGAWEKSEIHKVSKPLAKDLSRLILVASLYDYAFITFSGHGYYLKDHGYEESRLCINDTEVFPVKNLNPGNARSLIISDACREITTLDEVEKYAKRFSAALSEAAALGPNRPRCRKLFDERVARAGAGTAFMYSCSIGEIAGESQIRGGHFSRGLVDTVEAWAEQGEEGVLDAYQTFNGACRITKTKAPKQNPVYEAGRRMVHFPFGVFAY